MFDNFKSDLWKTYDTIKSILDVSIDKNTIKFIVFNNVQYICKWIIYCPCIWFVFWRSSVKPSIHYSSQFTVFLKIFLRRFLAQRVHKKVVLVKQALVFGWRLIMTSFLWILIENFQKSEKNRWGRQTLLMYQNWHKKKIRSCSTNIALLWTQRKTNQTKKIFVENLHAAYTYPLHYWETTGPL